MADQVPGLPVGQLGPFRLIHQLGAGGMGVVYLAQDQTTGAAAAVKLIRPEHVADPDSRTRLRRDVDAARWVPRFCTAPVLAADLDSDPPWVATEYIAGPTLDMALVEQGRLTGYWLAGFAFGIALAVRTIHQHGVVHRNLKPSNILLSQNGPRVIDFGIARIGGMDTRLTHTGAAIGTPDFLAPEQVREEPATPAVDVFAWASVVAYAATGKPSFGSGSVALHGILHEPPALDGIDEPLRSLLTSAFHKEPSHRPSAAELVERLARAAPETTTGVLAAAAAPERVIPNLAPAPPPASFPSPPPASFSSAPPGSFQPPHAPWAPPPAYPRRRSNRVRAMLIGLTSAGVAVLMVLTALSGRLILAELDRWGEEAAPEPGAPALAACLDQPADCNGGPAREGGSIVWAMAGSPEVWFPLDFAGSVYTSQAIAGVMAHTGGDDPAGDYQFNLDLLADEPTVVNEDPWMFQFTLRDEAVWNDGTPISADDFRAVWYLASGPEKGFCNGCNPRDGGLNSDDIASVEGSDSGKTVTITLRDGTIDPEFFTWGGADSIAGGLVPWHIAEEQGWDWDDADDVGAFYDWLHTTPPTWSGGPFQLVAGSSNLDREVVWEPNPLWYGQSPPLERVEIRFLTDLDALERALLAGEVDGASPPVFDPELVARLDNQPELNVHLSHGSAWDHLDINLNNSQLSDPALRRAIFTALDVPAIGDTLYGSVFPELRFRRNYSFAENSPHFVDQLAGTGFGTGDLERARQILAAAGYHGYHSGETLSRNGEPIETLELTSTGTESREIAKRQVREQLAGIGIDIDVRTADNLGTTLLQGDFDLIIFGGGGGPASSFTYDAYLLGHSESSGNFGGYNNPDYDEAALRASTAPDPPAAAEATNQAYEILVPDAYILPLYEQPLYYAVADGYVNVRDNPYSAARSLYNVGQWGHTSQ